MKIENFVFGIVKKIEAIKDGVIAFAYKAGNSPMTHVWYEIAVSDYDFYSGDKRFKTLTSAWHKAAKAQGKEIIFVCRTPKEKQLEKLASEGNLILNI